MIYTFISQETIKNTKCTFSQLHASCGYHKVQDWLTTLFYSRDTFPYVRDLWFVLFLFSSVILLSLPQNAIYAMTCLLVAVFVIVIFLFVIMSGVTVWLYLRTFSYSCFCQQQQMQLQSCDVAVATALICTSLAPPVSQYHWAPFTNPKGYLTLKILQWTGLVRVIRTYVVYLHTYGLWAAYIARKT